ncbi:hypothetical protein M9H77_08994 [Catharanthus roseus]|uniref:Uncharacterized protein n=1 Tax=Catharanthus roseus TaxID=4058 RepID=A0ACC0BZP2_CATRO|nr:hypothetical protein M9H77_08994 [Catharanthus roseus]
MARPYQENREDILKAQTVIEFALENLKLFSLLKSVTLITEMNEIESLYTNLKFLQNFIERGQENFNQDPSFSEQVVEIFQVVDELLVVTDSAFYSNLSDTSRFLRYSPRFADLVQKTIVGFCNALYSTRIADLVREIREIVDGPKTEDGIFVITDSGYYGNLLGRVDFNRYCPEISNLVRAIRSMEEKKFDDPEKYVVTKCGFYINTNRSLRYRRGLYHMPKGNMKDNFPTEGSILVVNKRGRYLNLSDMRSGLCHSARIAALVQNIRSIEEAIYAGSKGHGVLVIKDSGFYCNLSQVNRFIGDYPRGHGKTISSLLKNNYAGPNIQGGILVVNDSGFKGNNFLPVPPRVVDHVDKKIRSTEERISNGLNVQDGSSSSESSSIQQVISAIVVGFQDETRVLRDRLIRGRMRLEVIPIVGMAGIGKTTIANKLYNDLSITYHFHIRAWTTISQAFDDIWDKQAWNELKVFFPDDETGSRILTTSRIVDVFANASTDNPPHSLRVLTPDESYDLFKHKVFADKICPEELVQIGKQIVEKCKGLPLAIVVVSGLLAQREKTQDWWRQVADGLSSSVDNEFEQIMDILSLSYTDLPPHLKSCFLYLGSFPEDYEIPVKGLLRSWIAEGFVEHWDPKVLEDVAENYLINLLNRSLITVAKKSSAGGIKSCHLHDVLRDFCLKKSNEKKFLQLLCKCKQNPTSPLTPDLDLSNHNPYPVQSFSDCQFFHLYKGRYVTGHRVSNIETLAVYRLLKVLDLRHIMLDKFPGKILELVHLRLLALWVDRYEDLPQAMFRLWNLETFILDGDKAGTIKLPNEILKMARLRHVKISKELLCDEWNWGSTDQRFIYWTNIPSSVLENLQSLSRVCPSRSFYILLSKTPNLKNLGLHLTFSDKENPSSFPDLLHLDKLEMLKFEYQTLGMVPFHIRHESLPPSLKKLTLVGSHVKWEEMSIIGLLPNLEVLKIKDNFFSGPIWETREKGFCSLKFLKLSHIDLHQWISCSSHFPRLEHLVLNGCLDLQEIPTEIGEIETLHTVEVYRSSSSTVEWAEEIQEIQCDVVKVHDVSLYSCIFGTRGKSLMHLIHGAKPKQSVVGGYVGSFFTKTICGEQNGGLFDSETYWRKEAIGMCGIENIGRSLLPAYIFHDQILNMSDEDMGVKLYKSLKGRRHFIVIDNVWDINFLDQLMKYLPEDDNGSRILFTKLESIGKCIVGECKGLPLAIVVIAGVLAKEKKTVKIWRDFARNVTKCRENMDILGLSYKHLARVLKSCFLFLGTFPLDYEILVKRLIWWWMGEGFIDDIPGKRLEDVGKNHVMNLVAKSLVIPLKLSSNCGIKSYYVNGPFVFNYCAMPSYKFLRRLELINTLVNFSDQQIFELIHFRYLRLKVDRVKHQIPLSTFELLRLELCILEVEKREGSTELTPVFEHFHISQEMIMNFLPPPPQNHISTVVVLENLQTISKLCPSISISEVLARTPNLRSLGFHLTLLENTEPVDLRKCISSGDHFP